MVKSSIFKTFVIVIYMLFVCVNLKSQIIINEVCPLNHKSLLDDDHSNEDWIELYNPSDTAVNLKGYRISDKNDFNKAWIFPDTLIQPKQFLTIFASGKDRYTDDKFIMETSGEGLYYWVNPEGYSFAYQEYGGDFEAKVRINTFQNGDFFANAGIMVREGLDNSSRFVSFVAREYKVDSDIFCKYRDTINNRTLRKEFYQSRHFDYPDIYLEMNRLGNLFIMSFTDISGFKIRTDTLILDLPKKIFLGLEGNSKNINQIANIFFSNYYLNNEKVDFNSLKFYEVHTGHKGKFFKNNTIHTNFKIGSEESIYLWNNTTDLIDNINLPVLRADNTFARENQNIINKNTPLGYSTATPDKLNGILYKGYAENPTFESNNLIFDNELSVKINELENSKIYFTLNSDEPDTTSFLADKNEVTINETTVFRARAFKDGYLPSDIITQTFIEGYKSKLPVISLVATNNELYSIPYGILNNVNSNLEIHGNIEFYYNLEKIINQKIGLKLHGGNSRIYDQKSVRIYARDEYGKDEINGIVLKNKSNFKIERLTIKNGGQDFFSTKLRDVFAQQLVKHLEFLNNLEFQPINLLINGSYNGLYNVIERFDDNYIKNKFQITNDSINIFVGHGFSQYGNGSIYVKKYDEVMNFDNSSKDYLNLLNSKINLNNYLDYIFINTFIQNSDWNNQNHISWNYNNQPLNFQPYDMDFSFGFFGAFGDNIFYNLKANKLQHHNLFFKIMENDSVRNYFILRSLDKINTAFTTDSMLAIFNPMVDLIKEDIPQHQARFPESVPNWNESIDSIRYFLKERPNEYRIHLAEYFNLTYELRNVKINFDKVKINFNTITLDKSFEGKYFLNQKITLEVDYSKDENFLYWLVNNEKYSSDKKIEILVTEDLLIVPVFELKYNDVISEKFDIISYPNPTDGIVYIELGNIKDTFGTDIKVNIFDNNQKLMNTIHFDKNEIASLNNILSVNLQNEVGSILGGVYYFQIIADEKVIYFDKVVLN